MSKKFKILTIGGSGLVGSLVNYLLSRKHNISDFTFSQGIDITNPDTLIRVLREDSEHKIVILYAAKADVDGCEKDKSSGEDGDAYKLNVRGVENVINACKSQKKKLVYISTDFVFDGRKKVGEKYNEEDAPNPINWYGQTKLLGETAVLNSGLPFLIARIGYPYRAEFELKKDFARAMLSRLRDNLEIRAVTDHIMTPTFIEDIAGGIDTLIGNNLEGIYHITGSQSLSPYDAAQALAREFGLDQKLIHKTSRAEFFKGRALRPFNLAINNDKICKLGVRMRSFEEGLKEIKL